MPLTLPLLKSGFDLDMAKLEDEQLVILVQDCDFAPARDELLLRCGIFKDRLVSRFASRAQLQEADCQDLQQDAVLWIIEAITHFKTDEILRPKGCRFRSFLYRVVTARLIDNYRQRRHQQKLCGLAGSLLAWLGEDSRWRSKQTLTTRNHGELELVLLEKIEQMTESLRQLWNLLVTGLSLREAAAVLNISYDKAKRRRRKLLTTLRSVLTRESTL